FAFLEIFVVLEEVLDAGQIFLGQVGRRLDVTVRGIEFVDRHSQQLGIATRFVVHLQHTDGARTDHGANLYGERRHHQHVDGISIVGNGLGNVAIVAGIVHGRQHEAVDKDGAGVFIDFVLDRIGIHGDFDNYIEFIRQFIAGGYAV